VNFNGRMEISFVDNEVDEVIAYDSAGLPVSIAPLTHEEILAVGQQVAYYFENSFVGSANIRMDATIAGMNKYASSDPLSEENQCDLDAGSTTTGTIDISWYPAYMKSMVYIQGLHFTVRKTSWQQIE